MSLTTLLNIKYPIILGGMANISLADLAAAVSNAGGLGIIGSGGWDADRLKSEIRKCKELLEKLTRKTASIYTIRINEYNFKRMGYLPNNTK